LNTGDRGVFGVNGDRIDDELDEDLLLLDRLSALNRWLTGVRGSCDAFVVVFVDVVVVVIGAGIARPEDLVCFIPSFSIVVASFSL